jgi:hypothetical protein
MLMQKSVFSVHGRAAVIATVAAVAPPRPLLLPVLSGPRSPRPRAALGTTATAARSITAQIRIITAVVPIITADMAMAACPITGAIP